MGGLSWLPRLAEVLGDAILLSFVMYLLTYESYEMREVWLARRLWVVSGSPLGHRSPKVGRRWTLGSETTWKSTAPCAKMRMICCPWLGLRETLVADCGF